MRIAYFDCFCGAAGDMTLGALLDAGAPLEPLRDLIDRLGLIGVSVACEAVQRHGLAATHARVCVEPRAQRNHRHLPTILRMIDAANLPSRAAQRARAIFQKLAEAEAAVHGCGVDEVHFHEVGADDAIVDIVGACVLLETLGVDRVVCSPIPTGSGTVKCDHGVMPVPAPATARLLTGAPLASTDEPGELTTPTGAAILTTLAESYGPPPPLRLETQGYGAGTRPGQTRPNVLRVLIGTEGAAGADSPTAVTVLETQVDDATGQTLGHAVARLLDAGALDAYVVPIMMKKGRPGQLLTVLCAEADRPALEDVIFAETTTFGVRRYACERTVLQREHATVATPFGEIRVKIGRRDGAVVQAWPEYEDCAAAAKRHEVALRTVQDAALATYRQTRD